MIDLQKEVEFHANNRAMLFLDAAISALLDTNTPEQVAEILRQQAKTLIIYG